MNYISNTKEEQAEMLKTIGVSRVIDLFKDIPGKLILKEPLKIPEPMAEADLQEHMIALSNKNKIFSTSFLGAGCYRHFTPSLVWHLIMRGEFLTSYTPYQPEGSQGMLQAIYEFQTMISELTGMDVANASMYDGATALGEAGIMSTLIKKRDSLVVAKSVHPEYREVLHTYMDAFSKKIVEVEFTDMKTDVAALQEAVTEDTAAVMVQYPNFFGSIENLQEIGKIAHEKGALLIVAVNEATCLGLLKSPGSLGAEIVIGDGHGYGNGLNLGGPSYGFMATKEEYVRYLPGRLAGATVDTKGRKGFILTLQAREQHIRREKASSNICTNQALCALASTIHLSLLGKEGVKELGLLNYHKTAYAIKALKDAGIKAVNDSHYNEFVIKVKDSAAVIKALQEADMEAGLDLSCLYPSLENHMLFCVTEMVKKEDIDKMVSVVETCK